MDLRSQRRALTTRQHVNTAKRDQCRREVVDGLLHQRSLPTTVVAIEVLAEAIPREMNHSVRRTALLKPLLREPRQPVELQLPKRCSLRPRDRAKQIPPSDPLLLRLSA